MEFYYKLFIRKSFAEFLRTFAWGCGNGLNG